MTVSNNAAHKIMEMTKLDFGHKISDVYKENLRELIHVFSNLYYRDANGNLTPIKCYHANPERAVAKMVQENNLVLPVITISEISTSNNDDRRRYDPILINEKYWDENSQRAVRLLSLSPRAVDINYEINILTKYKEDMDQIRSSIYSLFNPHLSLKTKYSNVNTTFINSEIDESVTIAEDKQNRILVKRVNLLFEGYIPSPKFLYTNTGKIEQFNGQFELVELDDLITETGEVLSLDDIPTSQFTEETLSITIGEAPVVVGGGGGGARSLHQLTDVDPNTVPPNFTLQDRAFLVWSSSSQKWVGLNLADLTLSATQVSAVSGATPVTVQQYLDAVNSKVDNLNFDGPYVNVSGDTMTGQLILPSISSTNYIGVSANQVSAVSGGSVISVQQYLDALSGAVTGINLDGAYVNVSGDTMTGQLIAPTISSTLYYGPTDSTELRNDTNASRVLLRASDIRLYTTSSLRFELGQGNATFYTGKFTFSNENNRFTAPAVSATSVSTPTLYTQTIENSLGSRVSINPSNLQGAWIYGNTRIQAGHLNFNGRTFIEEDAADIVALRNTTTAQTFRIYNTYGGSPAGTDREYANLGWNSNTFSIGTEASGGFSVRNLSIATSGVARIFVSSTGFVGIGNSSPTAPLHVSGPDNTTVIRVPTNTQINLGNSYLIDSNGALFITSQSNQPLLFRNGTTNFASFNQTDSNFVLRNSFNLSWGSTGTGTPDNYIKRISAGLLEVSSTLTATSALIAPTVSATNVTAINGLTLGYNQGITNPGTRTGFNVGGEGIATVTREGTKRAIALRFDAAVGFNDTSDPANTDTLNTFISRASQGVLRVTSSIEALSSIRAPIVSATTYLNLSASIDNIYVNQSGDTMTGPLNVYTTSANTLPLLDLSSVWNTGTTPTAIKLNVSDVSSNTNSLLMSLSTDNSNNFIVRKDGYTASRLSLASNGLEAFNTGDAALSRTSSARVIWLNADSGVRLGSGMAIKWASTSQVGAEDTILSRVSPGVISATSAITTNTLSAITLFVPTVGVQTGGTITPDEAYRSLTFSAITAGSHVGFKNMGLELGYTNTAYSILYFGNQSSDNTPSLVYDGVQALAQRRGNIAQTFRIYNTYTSSNNFERANLTWSSNTFTFGTEAGSAGGTSRQLVIATSGIPRMVFSGTGARIDSSGMFVAGTIYPSNQTIYSIRNQSNRIEFYANDSRFFASDSQSQVVIPTNGRYGFGPGDADTYISRASLGLIRVTSSIEALSSITAPIVSATTYLNLYPSVSSLLDGNYVNVSGDTMTGALTVSAPTTTALTVVGTQAQNNGFFSVAGDADKISYVMRATTKNGSSIEMFLDGSSTRQIIPANTSWNATVRIVAKTDKYENRYATFDRKLLIIKGDTNATTQIIGPVQVLGIDTGSTAGSPPVGWGVTLTADTTNGSLKINVTGEVGTYIRWVANVDLVEVGYEGSFAERTESLFANGEEGVWFDASGFDPAWRRNLFTYTEDFSNAVWQKTGTGALVSGSTVAAPDGTFTASTVYLPTGGGATQFYQTLPTGQFGNVAVTQSLWMRSSTNNQITFGFYDSPNADVSTVTLTSNWQQYTITRRSGFTSTFNDRRALWLYLGGAGTATIDIWHPQLEFGLSATPYQKIITPQLTFIRDIIPVPLAFQSHTGVNVNSMDAFPVWAVEQPVGLLVNKSQGAGLGNELVTNGNFLSGSTGWTLGDGWVYQNGRMEFNTTGNSSLGQSLDISSGSLYRIEISGTHLTQGGNVLKITNGGGLGNDAAFFYTEGRHIYYYIHDGGVNSIDLRTIGAVSGYVNSVSVKRVIAKTASQSTEANKPILRARYNLLTYSEQFDNVTWEKNNINAFGAGSVANTTATLDPIGGYTADYIQENNTVNVNHRVAGASLTIPSSGVTHSVYAKAAGRTAIMLTFGGPPYETGVYDLQTGAFKFSGNGTGSSISVGNGWYRCILNSTSKDIINDRLQIFICSDYTNSTITYTGTGTSGVYLWGAQIDYGSSVSRYQRIAAATDYDISGFLPYLSFDGANDYLTAGDVVDLGSSSYSVYAGIGPSTSGSIFAKSLQAAGLGRYALLIDSTSLSATSLYAPTDPPANATIATPSLTSRNNIFSVLVNRPVGTNVIRLNASTSATSLFTSESTNHNTTYRFLVGAYNNASDTDQVSYLKGSIYSLIMRRELSNNFLHSLVEKYVAQQTGVTLP